MKSNPAINKLLAKLQNQYATDGNLASHTKIIDSKIVISTINESYEHNEIEIDASISAEDVIDLKNRIGYLATKLPDSFYYANSWLSTFKEKSDLIQVEVISDEETDNLFSGLSLRQKNVLKKFNECELLFDKIYQAITIFTPLIFIELGLRKRNNSTFKSVDYILNQSALINGLKKDVSLYKEQLFKAKYLDILRRYIQLLPIEPVSNNGNIEISRAHYALLVMALSGLPDEYIDLALSECKWLVAKNKKEKPTRIIIHTLCCIIYSLLMQHSIGTQYDKKSICRGYTGKILSSFSPHKENGEPYYVVNERVVEYALTR